MLISSLKLFFSKLIVNFKYSFNADKFNRKKDFRNPQV